MATCRSLGRAGDRTWREVRLLLAFLLIRPTEICRRRIESMPRPDNIVAGDIVVREFSPTYLIWRVSAKRGRWPRRTKVSASVPTETRQYREPVN